MSGFSCGKPQPYQNGRGFFHALTIPIHKHIKPYKPTNKMKKQTFWCATTILLCGAVAVAGVATANLTHERVIDSQVKTPEVPTISHDGAHFELCNVVETFGYNDSAWYMTYDDPDAGYDFEVIRIDRRTHDAIISAQEHKKPLTGTLHATKAHESLEYSLDADNLANSHPVLNPNSVNRQNE